MSPFANTLLRSFLAVLALSLAPTIARAGTGGQMYLPLTGVKPKSGLRLEVDNRGVDSNGYRPYIVTLSTINGLPLKYDRYFRVVITPQTWSGGLSTTVEQVIEFPEASSQVTAEMLIPQSALSYSIGIEVHEDGRMLQDLSNPNYSLPRTNYWNWTEASPAILVIDSDVPLKMARSAILGKYRATGQDANRTFKLPDLRNVTRMFPDSTYAGALVDKNSSPISDLELLVHLAELPRCEYLPPSEVADNWLALSTYDFIIISLADLQSIDKNHPETMAALRQWNSVGCTLAVYDVGDNFESLDELRQVLAMAEVTADQSTDDAADYPGWKAAPSKGAVAPFSNFNPNQPGVVPNWSGGVQATLGDAAEVAKRYGDPPFLVTKNGLGHVVAMRNQEPFPGNAMFWSMVLGQLGDEQFMWVKRHGMSLHRPNDDYWNFFIRGVGDAPVFSFTLFITLFALVIGPMNYWLLGRWKRTYLVLLTVPLGAVLVTGMLFIYALATDGIGVRARLRSVTVINPETAEFAMISRQSYYASIAPSQGLVFPTKAAIYPLEQYPAVNYRSTLRLKMGDQQQLQNGYIKSRTLAQFMVLQGGSSESRLQVTATGGKCSATNQLGVPLSLLVVHDLDGKLYVAHDVAADAKVEMTSIETEKLRKELIAAIGVDAPALPSSYYDKQNESLISYLFPGGPFGNAMRASWSGTDGHLPPVTQSLGLMEVQINSLRLDPSKTIPKGEFVALGERSQMVPLGVSYASERQSLHLIRGRYSPSTAAKATSPKKPKSP